MSNAGTSLCLSVVLACAGDGVADEAAKPAAKSDEVRPFKIRVEDAVLDDLAARLARSRFPDEIEGAWEYGVSLAYTRELVEYWRTGYDWRAQERRLNQFDQFVTAIDGLDIHFVHVRSARLRPQRFSRGTGGLGGGQVLAWSDHGGKLENSFTKDELLTNVMIYWVTQTMPSSVRIYYESSHNSPRPASMTPFTGAGKPAPMDTPCFPRRSTSRRVPGWSAAPEASSHTGPKCRAAVTSPRWSSPSCWWTTSARSSGDCGRPSDPIVVRFAT